MKKSMLLKKLVLTAAAVIGLFAFGGATAQASSVTPSYGHFSSKTITYNIQASSTYYRNLWNTAISRTNALNVVKLVPNKSSKTRADLTLLSRASLPNNMSGYATGHQYWGTRSFVWMESLINRRMRYEGYNHNDMQALATQLVASAIGLSNNNSKSSLLYSKGFNYSYSPNDVLGLARDYANVK